MPKQISTKKQLKHSPEGPMTTTFKPKKMGSEIDDIFAGKKRKNLETDNKAHTKKPMKVLASNDVNPHDGLMRVVKIFKRKPSRENEPIKRTSTRSRKKTAEGLTIYTEDELGVGKVNAGGTRLCPFDCDCCF
ncbi:hypothetical protein CASFOL_006239 [Castilleja foliolosa]|uniref:DUF1764-domain-containing protein n=1 Tax=Castilleja foliolosa TaxID=1961234 RepID=A0ABD3E5X1_9LAMI